MKRGIGFVCLLWMSTGVVSAAQTVDEHKRDTALLQQIQLLNQVSEDQLNDKRDPVLGILRQLNDQDGPAYFNLRRLLGQTANRSTLSPGVRAILATLITPRWDAYNIAGNLWLGGLRSNNTELRERSTRRLPQFIQSSHVPVLIELLRSPVSSSAALRVLRETTGQTFGADPAPWLSWWRSQKPPFDLVGYLMQQTQKQLANVRVENLDQEKLWYLPEGVTDKSMLLEKRGPEEQLLIRRWNGWVAGQAQRVGERWSDAKTALERISHHPDPRINTLLESLVSDPGLGDYASIVLAWRQSDGSLPLLKKQFQNQPTVGRALARGSLGDKSALVDLLRIIERHQHHPSAAIITEEETRQALNVIRSAGIIPAETAFELLCHRSFGFDSAVTVRQKTKAYEKAKKWLLQNAASLQLDRRRGYYVVSSQK